MISFPALFSKLNRDPLPAQNPALEREKLREMLLENPPKPTIEFIVEAIGKLV